MLAHFQALHGLPRLVNVMLTPERCLVSFVAVCGHIHHNEHVMKSDARNDLSGQGSLPLSLDVELATNIVNVSFFLFDVQQQSSTSTIPGGLRAGTVQVRASFGRRPCETCVRAVRWAQEGKTHHQNNVLLD